METPNESLSRDFSLAHALLRICLGVNLFAHGLVRIPHLVVFIGYLQQTLAKSGLPGALITAAGYSIPFVELSTGALLLLGLFLRPALVLGSLLMIVLMLGICLAQNWTIATQQLVYMVVFALLLATARHDHYSLDGWRSRKVDDR